MSRRQPGVEGEHTGLDAEAQNHEEGYHQHQFLISGHSSQIQGTAGQEGKAVCKPVQEENAEQHHIGAKQRVEQILQAALNGFLGTVVQNQRHRQKAHEFVEQVVGHHAAGKHQAVQGAVDHQIETEEPGFFLFVLHIFKGINARQNPDRIDHHGKELAHGIHMKVEVQILAEGEQHQLRFSREYHPHGQSSRHHQTCTGNGQKCSSVLKVALQQDTQAQQNGQ